MLKAQNPIDEVQYCHGSNVNSENDSQFRDIDVPKDGNCLFWSVAMAYLIPSIDSEDLFQKRCKDLFGNKITAPEYLENVRSSISNLDFTNYNSNVANYENSTLKDLVTNVFRNRVVDYISSHGNEFKDFVDGNVDVYLNNMRKLNTWGGEHEIKAMSKMLQIGINIHGESILQYNESCSIKIQLSYVNALGGKESRNHYKFALANNHNNDKSLGNKSKDKRSSPLRSIENSPTRRRNFITLTSPDKENSPKKRKYSDSFKESTKDDPIFGGKTSTPLKNQESIESDKIIGISPIKPINESLNAALHARRSKRRRIDNSGVNLSQCLDNESNHSQKKLSSKSNQSKPSHLTIISDSGFVSNLWDESNNSQQSSKTYKRQLSSKEEENNRSRKKTHSNSASSSLSEKDKFIQAIIGKVKKKT